VTAELPPVDVPIWPQFVRPVLAVLAGGQVMRRREILTAVQDQMELSQELRNLKAEHGDSRVEDRAGWAITHMFKAGWLERPERATYRITEQGRAWFHANPHADLTFSDAHALFKEFWPGRGGDRNSTTPQAVMPESAGPEPETNTPPDEQIRSGIDLIHSTVADDLLGRLRGADPAFFETAVVDLLLAMGYGGAEQRGKRIGGSGDGGVDGVIDQDPLGLDQIYVQAKRYADGNNIGRETIQAFVGALAAHGASRGVFITTSAFSRHARDYAAAIPTRIILIDAQRLTDLMIKYKVGVQVARTYEVVDIDEDYFE
jgi:restriction system protein